MYTYEYIHNYKYTYIIIYNIYNNCRSFNKTISNWRKFNGNRYYKF